MKLFLILIAIPIICYSQDETLIGDDEISSGGFGGPAVKITKISQEIGILVGGRGGWILNHRVILGGGGYGIANRIFIKTPDGIEKRLSFGYGGFELGYLVNPHSLFHAAFTLLIGGGGADYKKSDNHRDDNDTEESSGIFVLEPEIDAELNIATYFRMSVGLSYRFVFGLDLPGLENKDLSFANIVLSFKFGSF